MNITIYPQQLSGAVTLPTSKSALHRAIIAACLARGQSLIRQVSFNDDAFYTLKALKQWGIEYTYQNNTLSISGQPTPKKDIAIIDCGESGSTLRFLIPLFSLFKQTTYIGKETLFTRPLEIYKNIYQHQNLEFDLQKNYLITRGQITPGNFEITNAKSSQFISGLLYYLPLLEQDSTIYMDEIVSKPYIDLTLGFLHNSKVTVIEETNKLIIPGRQQYQPIDITLEGDLSQLGYFLALGSFGGPITIHNINFNSLQGDKQIIDLFTNANAKITTTNNSLTIYQSKLTSFNYDLQNTPDLGLLLFALAACIDGSSRINNISRLKYKESNRLQVGLKIITSLGANYKLFDNDNSIEIYGNSYPKNILNFDSYQDHRVCFTLAAISPLLQQPLTITNASVVSKSYPHFWQDFKSLGGVFIK